MLRKLWNKVATQIRPDPASLKPFVDFDPQVGSISISLEAEVRGQRVHINRQTLTKGWAFAGYRKFRLQPSQIKEFQKILTRCQWRTDSTITCEESNVTGCLNFLRNFGCRQSANAEKVTTRNVQAKVSINLEPDALRFQAVAETESGETLQLDLANLSSDIQFRRRSSFYRVSPVPPALLGSMSSDGRVAHDGDVTRARELASTVRDLPRTCIVSLSPESKLLLNSAESPVPVKIRPKLDLVEESGQVKVVFNEMFPDGKVEPARIDNLHRPHLFGGIFCEVEPQAHQVVEKLTRFASLETGNNGAEVNIPHNGNIDRARELASTIREIRGQSAVELSPAVELFLQSAESPVSVEVIPTIDFKTEQGTLNVALEEALPDGRLIPPDIAWLRNPHLTKGMFCTLSQTARDVVERLSRLGGKPTETAFTIAGKDVPEMIRLLREYPFTKETPAAKNVKIDHNRVESRTFIEIEDPETLIVRQNFQTSDGREIKLPDLGSGADSPDWIRVKAEYFRGPEKKIRSPSHGQKLDAGKHRLTGDDVPDFLDSDLPSMRQTSRVFADPEFSSVRVVTAAPELQTEIDLNENTSRITVRPRYRSGTTVLDHAEVPRADRKRRYYRRGSTYHRLDWELFDKVREAVSNAGLEEETDGSFTGPSLHYDEIINRFSQLGILSQTELFERFMSRLFNFANIEEVPLPSTLRPEVQVREYQQSGYHWLAFIKKYGLPAVLADEMGLGKTLQSLLAVAHLKDLYGRCPSLVVCPAALVNKWFDETGKFFVGLRPLVYWGQRRRDQLRENIGTADIVITTYQTLRSDAEHLARWKWRFLIADEAQRIKNPGIQLVASIKQIPAEARIAITGTPVENKTRDLWSLFDFLAHGYLGSLSSFERSYSNPIEKWGDKTALEKLLKRTKPFVLRRLKKSVATELPEKIYKHMRCQLSTLQRQLYKAVVDRDLKTAIDAVGGKPLSLGNPHIFAVLTKLKQICCHPGLITNDYQPYKSGVSGKFDTFTEIVEEILEESSKEVATNKLVGISQYVGMTGYLHDYVKSQGKECSLIDGKVPPQVRPEMCKTFNSDPKQFGMMLTLMAGGVGLDLPGANHVVLYDRWWNPAVEDQAIDRVHRIGQEREVIVFTITATGTLEEKIEQKLRQKRDIFDLVIRPDELLRKEITRDELMELVKLDE